MIITCPECATEFKTPDSVFVNGPRKLRCAKCAHVWMQNPDDVITVSAGPADETDDSDGWAAADGADATSDELDFDNPQAESADEKPDDADAGDGGDFELSSDAGDGAEADQSDAPDVMGDEDDKPKTEDEDSEGEEDEQPLHDIESEAADGLDSPDKKSGFKTHIRSWGAGLAAVLALIMAGGGAYMYRAAVTQWLPQTAPLYAMLGAPVNLTGFEFNEVGVGRSFDNGFPVLSVKGKLVNVSDRPRSIPDIKLVLRAGDKQEVYHWTIKVKRAPLKPNEIVQFSTRLASPPSEAEDIVIRFHPKTAVKLGAL